MYSTPYVASLRAYEPIDSFNDSEQLTWLQFVDNFPRFRDEQIESLKRAITNEPPNLKLESAYFLELSGEKYLAPWSTSARCCIAFADFKSSLPSSVVKFFVPKILEDSINSITDKLNDKVSHILTSNWSIPPRWFALFSPEDRIYGANEYGNFMILRTSITNAKSRCSFTYQAVYDAFGYGVIESEVARLLEWLEIFDERSIIELDYGGLARLLNEILIKIGETGLGADTSIEDVANSIAGLASGDSALASRGYQRLLSRWRQVSSLESAT